MYSNRFCSYRGSYKPGPWTLDWWTGLWTGLKTFGNEEFCGLLNSLQVAGGGGGGGGGRKEPRACGLKIAHDCTSYAMICMHATLQGGLVTIWLCLAL